MRSSNSDITAPISRTRRRKSDPLNDGLGIIVFVACALLIFVICCLFALPQGHTVSIKDKGHADDGDATRSQPNLSLRRAEEQDLRSTIRAWRGLLILTHLGTIRIYFTPELSGPTSIEYIQKVVSEAKNKDDETSVSCDRCNFYRAEPDLLLQGVISQPGVKSRVELGSCPEADWKPTTPCPAHDPNCGCHGPIMTRGMVGWAGGASGPDFFINTHKVPVDWWEHQHTVWGQVRDDESLELVERIYKLPATGHGMRLLDDKIQFHIELF